MDTRADQTHFYPLFSTLTRLETELWDAVDARLRQDCSLPLGRFEAMVVITSLGTCRVFDIASALSITVGGASKLVDRIEAAGFCSRKMNPGDRRSSLLDLTEEGKAVVARGRAVIEAELDSWFTPALSPTETTTLLELLARLRSARQPSLDSKAAA